MTNNRSTNEAFRLKVMINLLQSHLRVLVPDDEQSPYRALLADTDAHTDIAGLAPWIVHVRTSASGEKLSEIVTDVTDAARAAGSDWAVAIMNRRGYPVEDSYAIMPLHVRTRIFRGEAPPPLHPGTGIPE